MYKVELITVVYNTPDLLWNLYKSVRKHLGDIPFRIIDGSDKADFIRDINNMVRDDMDGNVFHEKIGYNIHHGRGMHRAISSSSYPHILIADSDLVFTKSGVVDFMMSHMGDGDYCVGEMILINGLGGNVVNTGYPYIHPKLMLINKSEYMNHSKFVTHGTPCKNAMIDLYNKGKTYKLKQCSLSKFYNESGRGTVNRFGYSFFKTLNREKMQINILIRTSGRPNYFRKCYESIMSQEYKHFNIIVSYDDDESLQYLKNYKISNLVRNEKNVTVQQKKFFPEINRYRMPAHWNTYFNNMYEFCIDGIVIYLDDDDGLTESKSLTKIAAAFRNSEDTFVMWRVLFPKNHLIPNDEGWGKAPICCNISGIGFAFHTKYLSMAKWDEFAFGDYMVSARLYDAIPNKVRINEALTKLNRSVNGGHGRRDDI